MMEQDELRENAVISAIQRVAARLADWSLVLACMVLLWLVGLTCVDVIGRYFFRAPVVGATELVQISMAGIIFFSLPAMFLRDDQVVVDLFAFVRRGWFGWTVSILFGILTIVAVLIVADRVYDYAVRAWEDGDKTIYLSIPRYLVVSLITLMIYISALFAGVRLLRAVFQPGKILPDETANPVSGSDQ